MMYLNCNDKLFCQLFYMGRFKFLQIITHSRIFVSHTKICKRAFKIFFFVGDESPEPIQSSKVGLAKYVLILLTELISTLCSE